MGTYLNPGNSGFAEMLKSDCVDKTGLIRLMNSRLGMKQKYLCVSRPRRFGKSYAAQMLCAYYDKTCDSHELFSTCQISADAGYEAHLNRYDVLYLDMTQITGEAGKQNFIDFIRGKITGELSQAYSELKTDRAITATLTNAVRMKGKPFIAIIDEWDSPIREIPGMEQPYLEFLRTTFKSSGPASTIFAADYMTGILPITKDGKASAVPDFEAHSVLGPDEFAGYVGFTEEEVKRLCEEKKTDFGKMKRWYDGYTVGNRHSIYNPYSVMHAARSGKFRSYWNKTSSAETLMTCMEMDPDDLQDTIARLIAGERVAVDTYSFRNDMVTFTCKDDVLTLLTHLGYLTCEEEPDSCDDEPVAWLVRIPNEEVRSEFDKILRKAIHKSPIERVRKSDQLLKDTLEGKSDAVAKVIAEVHDCEYARTCSNEQSLRVVVKMAYISCVDQYARVEELPSGHGIADVVFLPRRRSTLPPMIVELKRDKIQRER